MFLLINRYYRIIEKEEICNVNRIQDINVQHGSFEDQFLKANTKVVTQKFIYYV